MAEASVDFGKGSFRLGKVYAKAFTVFGRYLVPFSVVSGILWAPFNVLSYYAELAPEGDQARFLIPALVAMVFLYPLGAGIVMHGTFQAMRGKPFSFVQSLTHGLERFPALLGVSILSSLGVVAGLIALIIPGIILLVIWYVAPAVCVLERFGATNSLTRSAALTKGYRWVVFAAILLPALLSGIVDQLLAMGGQTLGGTAAVLTSRVVWGGITQAFVSVLTVVIYYDLRVVKEGLDVGSVAEVFE